LLKNVVTLNNFNDTAWYCDDCGIDFGVGDVEDIIEEFLVDKQTF